MGIQMGAQGLMMKHSRSDESQADAVGALILYKAGYNPQAMADFFKTLESQGGPAPPQFFSDHPNPGNRELAIETEIKIWPAVNYTGDSPAFQTVRQHAVGVKAYTSEEIAQGAKLGQWAASNKQNGATFNPTGGSAAPTSAPAPTAGSPAKANAAPPQSVLPGNRMVTANIGPVKINHPENWQVKLPDKDGQFATIAPQAGITGKGVGYGVLLNGIAAPQGGRTNIDDVTGKLVQEMQNNGLEPLGNPQPVIVAGVQGRSVMFHSASPLPGADGQPQLERDWLVSVPQRDGSVVFMIFVSPQSQFASFQPTYDAMLKSLQLQ
jgi:hypothetical protein